MDTAATQGPVQWLKDRLTPPRISEEERRAVIDKIFMDGEGLRSRLWRFSVLLVLSVIIATLGLTQNSAAVIIGAMIVAPLMGPVLGAAAAIALGMPAKIAKHLGIVAAGIIAAVGIAALLTWILPERPGGLPDEVLARTTPNFLDLIIALAAGAAGAYANARPDVSDALPGVAIAVSLVPPLSATGLLLVVGEPTLALGSFVLFLANLAAIVLAGAVVFLLAGLTPAAALHRGRSRILRGLLTSAAAVVIIAVPLIISGQQSLTEARLKEHAAATIKAWLLTDRYAFDYVSLSLQILDDKTARVSAVLTGKGSPPSNIQDLAERMSRTLDMPVVVKLDYLEYQEVTAESEARD